MGLFKKTAMIGKLAVHVAVGAASCSIRGVANTIGDAAKITDRLVHKDYDGALDVAGKRVTRMANGVGQTVNASIELADEVGKCVSDRNREFLTEKNLQRMTVVGTAALLVGVAGNLCDDDPSISDATETSDGLLPLDTYSFAIDNGVFVGNESDLQELIEAGKVEGTEHISSDDISRNIAARTAFLKSHGFDEIPAGYDVHHIVPLCEGGADTPDNMVLVSENDHERITAEHGRFYGWHSRA